MTTEEDGPIEETPELPIPRGVPLLQISEPDLAELERMLPLLMWVNCMTCNETSVRMKWRKVQQIISNVRWGGGPPSNVGIVP